MKGIRGSLAVARPLLSWLLSIQILIRRDFQVKPRRHMAASALNAPARHVVFGGRPDNTKFHKEVATTGSSLLLFMMSFASAL